MTKRTTNGKLTDVRLKALLERPPAKRLELKDGTVDGLVVRVGPRGLPTWTFRFRVRGDGGVTERGTALVGVRHHRVSLGTYPDVSLSEARRKASAYLDDAKAGRNPLSEFEEKAVDGTDTVAKLVEDFLVHAQSLRTGRHAEWCVNRHIVPAWGERPVGGITERDAKNLIDKVAKGKPDPKTGVTKPRPGAAGDVRKWGLALFRFAIEKGRARANPFAGTNPPKLAVRQRFLELDEARAVYTAAGELREPWRQAIRLLMLTGCREMEICAAQRAWLDKTEATLLIPPEHYKSGRHFLVTLPTEAVAVIESLRRWNGGDFLLSTTNGEKPIAGVLRKIIDDLHEKAERHLGRPMNRFALHDLRRTVRTHLPRLGVDDVVAELVLGHTLKGLRATYNLYGFAAEKRKALELWAADLLNVGADDAAESPSLAPDEVAAAIAEGRLPPDLLRAVAAALGHQG